MTHVKDKKLVFVIILGIMEIKCDLLLLNVRTEGRHTDCD